MTKHNTPVLRFDGFDGEWVTSELNDLVEVGNGRDYKHLNEGSIPVYGTGGYMLSVDQALSYSKDAIGIGRKGTIDKPYLLRAPFWTVDTLFFVMARSGIDLPFLFSVFQRIDWKSKNTATGVPSLTSQAIERTTVTISSSLEEQRAIGELFADLDALIEQHRAKHANLQQTKIALLQRVFPQDGADEPELRLGGFSGAWAYTKLADIARMYQPQTVSSKKLQRSGVPVFGANGYIGFYHKANHVSDQVTISARGENTGTPSYVAGPVWITGNSMVVNVDSRGIDKKFLYGNLSSRSLKSLVTGGAQPQLTRVVLNEYQISIPPTLDEQRAIGEVFADLDALIAAEASYITQLTQAKTALLQRMFV